MTRARPWLPDACLREPCVARPAARILADWAKAWFARPAWDAPGIWATEPGARENWPVLRDAGRIALAGAPGAIQRLAFAMLGEPERANLTTRDLRLLRRLAGDALDDLVGRLEAGLPGRGSLEGSGGERWGLDLDLEREPILHLSLDRADLSRLARESFAPARAAGRLEPAGAAVAEVAVPVAGEVGRVRLAIAQIGALEPGDVLLLGREADAPIELVVAGRRTSLRCTVAERDGGLGLVVCDPQ